MVGRIVESRLDKRIFTSRLILWDVATILLILPIAVYLVWGTSQQPWFMILPLVLACLCAATGLIAMMVGFALWLAPSRRYVGERVVRYGAGLGTFFGATVLFLALVRWLGGD